MKKLLFLLIAVGLGSCSISSAPSESQATDVIGAIRYDKDPRTGLCFAITQSQHEGFLINSIACVPCDSLKRMNATSSMFGKEPVKK